MRGIIRESVLSVGNVTKLLLKSLEEAWKNPENPRKKYKNLGPDTRNSFFRAEKTSDEKGEFCLTGFQNLSIGSVD